MVVPTSCPVVAMRSPIASVSSLTNGPDPTRVAYAFITPITSSICIGAMPPPVAAPPAIGCDEVTYGYEPWLRSRSVPCAPSKRRCSPAASARCTRSVVSVMCGRSRSPHAAICFAIASASTAAASSALSAFSSARFSGSTRAPASALKTLLTPPPLQRDLRAYSQRSVHY